MKTNVYLGIAIRIIALFTVGSLMTFLPELLRDFFGDKPALVRYTDWGDLRGDGSIDQTYIWGSRHYWYFWMMILLFILSVINVIISIRNILIKHYPETFE